MNYYLYINILFVLTHCVFAVHVYGLIISILTHRGTKVGTREEWKIHRATALILALCVPMSTALVIYINLKFMRHSCYFMFSYPYDELQYQECDDTYLKDIWVGEGSVTKHVKTDWRKLNVHFKNIGTH